MIETTTEAILRIVRETLALAEDELVSPEHLLFYDLQFTSMDLVDFLFRVEDELGVPITEDTIYEQARGDLHDADFCSDGVLSEAGRERLMKLLPETPPQLFPAEIGAQTLPRYCTIASVARLVENARSRC